MRLAVRKSLKEVSLCRTNSIKLGCFKESDPDARSRLIEKVPYEKQ